MFDMFDFYEKMKAEDAAAAALKAKEEKEEKADYSPEPDEIKPVKKEETANQSKIDNTAEPKPIEKPIEGE